MASEVYDAVVIGSGAGGGTSAWALTRAGMRVLVLEAGPRFDPFSDYLLDKPHWEQTDFPEKTGSQGRYTFGPMQKLEPAHDGLRTWNRAQRYRNNEPHRIGYKYSHVQGVGGSTLHFTGEAHRMNPADMSMKDRFGVAADWPVGYDELEPYYSTAERIIGVAGPHKDPIRYRSEPYPLPPHRFSYASQRVVKGLASLGLSWTPNSLAVLSQAYDGRPGCNYCGNCNRGCPRTDKGSVDVTFIAKAMATGRCTLLSRCQVLRLESGASDKVTGVIYVDKNEQQHIAMGRIYILACGAVQSPRLLLISESNHAPHGLANDSGQVGRNFMETLTWVSSGLSSEPLGSHRGLPSDGICWDYNAPDAIPGVIGGCRFTLSMAESDLVGPINYARRVVPGWGKPHKAEMRQVFGKVLGIGAIGESLPDPMSYIDIARDKLDENGLPMARINSHLSEMEIKRIEFMASTCREMLIACGVSQLFEEYGSYDAFASTHVFGTCRMGNDPETAVVDAHCRNQRWHNLFVVDASVFPSSGGGESPSLTIEALAIRTGEYIRDAFARREI